MRYYHQPLFPVHWPLRKQIAHFLWAGAEKPPTVLRGPVPLGPPHTLLSYSCQCLGYVSAEELCDIRCLANAPQLSLSWDPGKELTLSVKSNNGDSIQKVSIQEVSLLRGSVQGVNLLRGSIQEVSLLRSSIQEASLCRKSIQEVSLLG